MDQPSCCRVAALGRASIFFAFTLVAVLLTVGPLAQRSTGQVESSPAMQLTKLGFHFKGAETCGGANCHDKGDDAAPPREAGSELSIWEDKDAHAESFKTLGNKDSKKIGEALKIADVTTSDRCLNCHSLNVPQNLRADKFTLAEGNTCESCHGPSEKWFKPHEEKEWVDQQRAKLSHEQLLKQLGLFDTVPLAQRAALCTSCHLAIDADLVAAGHPQTKFELDTFSNPRRPYRHWPEEGELYATKQWLAGQAAELRDAMQQLVMRKGRPAELVKPAYEQAMAHLTVVTHAADALGMDAAKLKAHVEELKKAQSANDADALAGAAGAVATMAEEALDQRANQINPTKEMTAAIRDAVLNDTSLATDYGEFGWQQQAWAIRAMHRALTGADPRKDDVMKLIEADMAPTRTPKEPITPEKYQKALEQVKSKLK